MALSARVVFSVSLQVWHSTVCTHTHTHRLTPCPAHHHHLSVRTTSTRRRRKKEKAEEWSSTSVPETSVTKNRSRLAAVVGSARRLFGTAAGYSEVTWGARWLSDPGAFLRGCVCVRSSDRTDRWSELSSNVYWELFYVFSLSVLRTLMLISVILMIDWRRVMWFLSSSVTVNWISSGLWTQETFDDVIFGFWKRWSTYFSRHFHQPIEKVTLAALLTCQSERMWCQVTAEEV